MKSAILASVLSAATTLPAVAAELSLAYSVGPRHPMNAGVFTPMGDMIEAESGGALNQSPPRQYALLLDGVADMVFMLPSFTDTLFPRPRSSACRTSAPTRSPARRRSPTPATGWKPNTMPR